jgi:SAM-dependent methyltransferase
MSHAKSKADRLAGWIDSQQVTAGDDWLENLGARKREEAQFHDADRQGHRDEEGASTPNRKFYEASSIVRIYMEQWIVDHAKQSTFLDYACGNGSNAILAAKANAALALGIDISEVSIRNAEENAQKAGVAANTRFLQRDCEATGLPDGSFDAILCSGMLHHLDLSLAYPELHRLVVPGGRILCVEALSYNPVIQFYRDRTPHLRTSWEKEHILGMREVDLARQWFDVENVRFFLLTAPLAALLPAGRLRRLGLRAGHALDTVLTRIPGLRLWSWQFSFELVRRRS